jgi:hypothetical protein
MLFIETKKLSFFNFKRMQYFECPEKQYPIPLYWSPDFVQSIGAQFEPKFITHESADKCEFVGKLTIYVIMYVGRYLSSWVRVRLIM